MKKDIEIFQSTAHLLFQLKKVILLLLDNADHLTKTVHFNVLKVIPNEVVGNVRKQFMLYSDDKILYFELSYTISFML
jgi:hypothetical protein